MYCKQVPFQELFSIKRSLSQLSRFQDELTWGLLRALRNIGFLCFFCILRIGHNAERDYASVLGTYHIEIVTYITT